MNKINPRRKKKLNPRRKPATQADVRRAENDAVGSAMAIFLTVMKDKERYTVEDLQRVWKEIEYLSDSISSGFVKVSDLKIALLDEANINLR